MPDLPFATSNPAALSLMDLYALEAVMLVPDDRGLQKVMTFASSARASGDPEPLDWVREAGHLKKAFQYGIMAGHAVESSLSSSSGLAITKLFDQLGARFALAKHLEPEFQRMSGKTFRNEHWARYRPVAHLWAAYVQQVETDRQAPFPCSYERLPFFLGLSEWYLGRASSTKAAPQASEPILSSAESHRPSEVMRLLLPPVEVRFHPPAEPVPINRA
jgi:hypothetical protein